MSGLELKNLRAGYGKKTIVSVPNLQIGEGEMVGLIGRNGCGKTTLLHAVCGIIPCEGQVLWQGEDLRTLSPKAMAGRVSFIAQRSGVHLSLSLLDVVLMGFYSRLGWLAEPTRAMRETAMEALAQVGLADRAEEDFQTLSEGQKQMVIFARALAMDNALYVLDEPESALDFSMRYEWLKKLRQEIVDNKKTALIALHDPQLALNFCDRLMIFEESGMIKDVNLRKADAEMLQQAMRRVYGDVCVRRVEGSDGEGQWVMIQEMRGWK